MRFYILDTRTVAGNCALWWRPGGHGYTTQLEEAGLFVAGERSLRETDLLVPEAVAQAHAATHVRLDTLRADPSVKWPEGR